MIKAAPHEPAPMHPNQSAAMRQRVIDQANRIDTSGFYHLLTGPQLIDQVAALVPEHRQRAFPPTETLAMFIDPGAL